MLEVITDIREATFQKERYSFFDGFAITTSKQQILLGISNSQDCCENWGYFMTNDDVQDFVGAGVIAVNVVDESLNVEKVPDVYDGNVMFVNIETTKGTLQFTAYNEHNGYYSHEAVVICEQLNHETYL